MKNNMITLLTLFLLANCTLIPIDESPTSAILFEFEQSTFINDSALQAQYQKEWLKNTKDITRATYYGYSDIWGDGALDLHLWFDLKGDMWDAMINVDNKPYVLYKLLGSTPMFLDGKTAIMSIPSSASPKLANTLYLVRVSNNTIYRSEDSRKGFAHLSTWNKKDIPTHTMIMLATNINPTKSLLSADMIKSGHTITYSINNGVSKTLAFSEGIDTIENIRNTHLQKITFKNQNIDLYIDTKIIYEGDSAEYTINHEGIAIQYQITIKNHKITDIKASSIYDPIKLNPTLFAGDHSITYYSIKYSTQGPPQAHGYKTNEYHIIGKDLSFAKKEDNVFWLKFASTTGVHDDQVPVDSTKDIANIVEYTIGNNKIELRIKNNKVERIYDKFQL